MLRQAQIITRYSTVLLRVPNDVRSRALLPKGVRLLSTSDEADQAEKLQDSPSTMAEKDPVQLKERKAPKFDKEVRENYINYSEQELAEISDYEALDMYYGHQGGLFPPVEQLFDKPYNELTKKERDEVEYYRRELDRFNYKKERNDLYDKNGMIIPNSKDLEQMEKNYEMMADVQPRTKKRFSQDEYRDWRKEVDKETVRTNQKIEHFKRSEELLQAIQQRIKSANNRESRQELNQYLMLKLGYKDSHYTDFVSNQMMLQGKEAKAEAKRTALLKANQNLQDIMQESVDQVRDSNTLNNKYAWNPDNYVPSSAVDVLGYQEERRLMTHKEFVESRSRDFEILQERRLLWNSGPESLKTQEDHLHEYRLKQLTKLTPDESADLGRELLKDMPKEVLEDVFKPPKDLHLGGKKGLKKQLAEVEAAEKAQQEQKDEMINTKIEENEKKTIEILKGIQDQFKKLEEVNPDTINTDDLTYSSNPDVVMSEGESEIKERKIDFYLKQDQFRMAEKVGTMYELSEDETYDSYNKKNLDQIKSILEGPDRASMIETIQKIKAIESMSEKESELEKENETVYVKDRDLDEEAVNPLAEYKLEQEYIFFREQKLYDTWASDILRQTGEDMTAEEAAKLKEVQEMIRDSVKPSLELGSPIFDMKEADFSKYNIKARLEAVQNDANIFTEEKLAEIDYTAVHQKALGTFEGNRRFERIDRISLEGGRDPLQELKLKARHDRVYDEKKIEVAEGVDAMFKDVINLNPYIKKSLKEERVVHEGKWERDEVAIVNVFVQENQGFQEKQMPKNLTAQEQLEWQKNEKARFEEFTKNEQLAQAHGRVEREMYIEDFVHRDKAAEMITQPIIDQQFKNANEIGLIGGLEQQYQQARQLEEKILAKRIEVAKMMNKSRKQLDSTMSKHDQLIQKIKKENANQELQFLQMPSRKTGEHTAEATNAGKFSPNSKLVSDYETELRSISQLGLHKTVSERDLLLKQFEFVFEALDRNRVPLTPIVRGHMFEYLAVRNDFELANNQLKFLTQDMTESSSPVDFHYLQLYLTNCLKHDKIDGIAYLTNFMQRYNVDSSSMPISKFHSMLDYYLNHNFDMSKVMIFCKFYRQFYSDTIAQVLPQVLQEDKQQPRILSDRQIESIKDRVFAPHESLVDMRALSKFLVRKTAGKQILDPLTREDSLQGLIDLFTHNPDVYQASSLSKNNHIEPSTIAEYLGHRLAMPDSLDHVMKIALRLNNTKPGREFAKEMLNELKNFQSKRNGELPMSFSKEAVKDLYLKVRTSEKHISSQTAELLLYVMHQKGLHGEVIDFCERRRGQTEIAKYYLTESLLALPLKSGSYASAIDKSERFKPANEMSAMELTQRTKAVMLDNGPQAAFDFFKAEFKKLEEKAQKKKAFLVSLYDTLMPNDSDLTFEQFVERYHKASNLASRLARESFVINKMEEILRDKKYQEVEDIINLYTVMREERLLRNEVYVLDSEQEVRTVREARAKDDQKKRDEGKDKKPAENEDSRLIKLQKRKAQLAQKVGLADTQALEAITNVMQDEKLTAFSEADISAIKSVAPIFADVSQEEAAAIEGRNKELSPDLLTKEGVISTLQAKGHDKQTIKKYYNLLDFNAGKYEYSKNRDKILKDAGLVSDDELEVQQKTALEVSDEVKAKQVAYDKLSKDEKKELRGIRANYKRYVRNVLGTKMSIKEAHKILREIEADPDNKIRDAHLRADYFDNFEDQSMSEWDARDEMTDGEVAKFEKLRARYIDKVHRGDPNFPIEEFLNPALTESEKNSDEEMLHKEKPKPMGFFQKAKDRQQRQAEENNPELFRVRKVLQDHGYFDNEGKLIDPVLAQTIYDMMKQLEQKQDIEKYLQEDNYWPMDFKFDEKEYKRKLEQDEQNKEDWQEFKDDHKQITFGVTDSELSELEDKVDDKAVFKKLWDNIKDTTEAFTFKRMQDFINPRVDETYYKDNIKEVFESYRNHEDEEIEEMFERPDGIRHEEFYKRIEKIRNELVTKPIGPEHMDKDPEVLQNTIHDASVFHMRFELLDAINKRKYNTLPTMIKLFNKIQSKQIGEKLKLNNFESGNIHDYTILDKNKDLKLEAVRVDDMGSTIQKLDLLLHDSRSPLISTLMDTGKYKESRLPENPYDYYKDGEAWTHNSVDVASYQRDLDRLDALVFEMERIETSLNHVEENVKKQTSYIDKSVKKKLHMQQIESKREISEKNLARLRQLYVQIKEHPVQDDDYKVMVMRDVLTLQLGQSFNVNVGSDRTAAQFPVFHAFDLINFGIKRNQPAAIRLGEKLLTESCDPEHAKLPQELAMSVKNFMLDYQNNTQYREAMKFSGPLNASALYHMSAQHSQTAGMTYCLDDPYWQEFMHKNRRREDLWRNPSIFAYRYKQYGLLGEIIDMQNIQKRFDAAFNQPM